MLLFQFRTSKGIAIGLFVVAISLAALGLSFVSIANHAVTVQNYSERWLKGLAKIDSVKIETKKEKKYPRIQYSFSVNDQSFSGTRIFFSDGPYQKVAPLENGVLIEALPPQGTEIKVLSLRTGESIDVFYNPHNPREAVLVRYPLGEMKMFMLLGILALVFGLFLIAKSLFYESID